MNLSNAQTLVINAPIGQPMQVLASAGSGKTRVLTERIRYILQNTKKDGVIALTFTNKAADEMMARLEGSDGLAERCWISTIHAVAQRILDQYGTTIGLPSKLHIYERDEDRKAVFLESLRSDGVDLDLFFEVSDEKSRARAIQSYMEQFSIIKRELLSQSEIEDRYQNNENFEKVYEAYQEALLASGGIDFDDILVYAYRILLEQPWCGQVYRAKYKHICVDEAQDLNKAQYEFLKAFCGDQIKSLMMVGDPNQMIYGFNGSSHKFLCEEFINDFGAFQFELKLNYRCSKAVINFANKIKPGSQTESEFALDGIAQIQENINDELEEAEWVCKKIKSLLDLKNHPEIEGEISLGKMVVIARNRFVFSKLEEELKKKNLPYSLKTGERQADPSSLFAKVLDLSIRLKLNPKDWIDGKKLCGVLKIKKPKIWEEENLFDFLISSTKTSTVENNELLAKLLMEIHKLDLESPNIPKFVNTFVKLFEDMGNSEGVEQSELERSLRELQDFRKLWTTYKRKGLGESLAGFRNALALGQLVEDYNPDGLMLSTVHTMKGLEKDIVFLIGMCEGVFPDYRAKSKKEIDEERNSAFVAITRSRRWIFITYPKSRLMPWGDSKFQEPSRFLRELKR